MIEVKRLRAGDRDEARATFRVMQEAFEAEAGPLSDAHVDGLLGSGAFWALSARLDGEIVGGLTAHTLPMTREEAREVFLYDISVAEPARRRGVGRRLVEELRRLAAEDGIDVMFVPADDEDTHALDFYRALGGVPAPVTIFTFGDDP